MAKDVCDILGIQRTNDAIRGLDEDETDTIRIIDAIGRNQKAYIVNEPGLYSLILRSRKPQAKEFKRWAAHELDTI